MKKLKLLTLIPAIFIVNLSANEPENSNNKTFSASKKTITKKRAYSALCEPHPKCIREESYYFLLDLLKQSFPPETKENNNKNNDSSSQ